MRALKTTNEEVTLDTGWPENHIVNLWKSLTWIKHKKKLSKNQQVKQTGKEKKNIYMVCVSTRKVTKSSKSPKRRLIEKNLVTGKISSNFFSVLKRRKKKITGPCVSTIIKKQTVIWYIFMDNSKLLSFLSSLWYTAVRRLTCQVESCSL